MQISLIWSYLCVSDLDYLPKRNIYLVSVFFPTLCWTYRPLYHSNFRNLTDLAVISIFYFSHKADCSLDKKHFGHIAKNLLAVFLLLFASALWPEFSHKWIVSTPSFRQVVLRNYVHTNKCRNWKKDSASVVYLNKI